MTYIPDRGDAVWINFDPQIGHEQAKQRPAIVLSPATYNGRSGLMLLCPITSRRKGFGFEVEVPAGYKISGAVLADQVRSFDWQKRNAVYIERLPDSVLKDVIARLKLLLPYLSS